ncbi:solute carrier family 2, facilitated glucose transporter member 5-like [Heteronotia binoei]|uniref:solute carrier family 2, facilitated glucose transporter member 5-like n=1 Tax=Heteronotia binoei TaxID=13085 RepID=UPI002930097F|nr:solute carrier family 2, facilitated glucose transporter member 5-like [Heteronotia binoei]
MADSVPKKPELTKVLTQVTLVSAFGSSFQYGYNLVVLNFPAQWMQEFYNQTYHKRNNINMDAGLLRFLWGLTITFFPIGGLVGTLMARPLADHCGRKYILVVNNLFPIVAAVVCSCSKVVHCYELIIFARLVIGICAGIACSVVPLYLGEVSPHNLRGAVIVVSHFFLTFGILVAQALSLHVVLGTRQGWPVLLFLTSIPALFQIFLLPWFPESPRYLLIQKGDEAEARKALQLLREWDEVEDEMEELRMEDKFENQEKRMSLSKLILCRSQQWQLLSIVVMTLSQHLSDLNAIHWYAEVIYLSTGVQEDYVRYITVMISATVIFITIITIFVVDSSGRRLLLLTGFGICSVCCVLLAMALELQSTIPWMSYFSTAFVILYVIGHSIGPSPVPRVMIAEMFLQSSRASSFMVGEIVHWVTHFLLDMMFIHMKVGLTPYSFLVFFFICLFAYVYIYVMVPETKKKSFVEIRKLLEDHMAQRSLKVIRAGQ